MVAVMTTDLETGIQAERRQVGRRRVLKRGLAAFNGGRSTFNCTVRNMSDTGALLRFENLRDVPDQFLLILQDGTRHQCDAKWRTICDVGVEFAGEALMRFADAELRRTEG